MRLRPIVLAAVVLVALVAVGEYYGGALTSGSSSGGVVINIQITGGEGGLTVDRPYPNSITVKLGQKVTLAILNTDDNTHGFVQAALGIDTGKILPGATYRLSFTPDQTGTYEFTQPPGYCTGGYGNICNSIQDMILNVTVIQS